MNKRRLLIEKKGEIEKKLKEIGIKKRKINVELEAFRLKNPAFGYKSFTEWENAEAPFTNKLDELNREKRLIEPYKLSEMPDYGKIMALKEFIEWCEGEGFIDYDGYGCYIKDGKKTNITIYPSDIKHNSIRSEFDTIIWFNR